MIGRVLALDVGDRRIGVAVSDPLGITVRALTTLTRARTRGAGGAGGAGIPSADIAAVLDRVRAEEAVCVVVGDPRLPSGDRGEQAERTDAFVAALAAALALAGIPIERWDESYTSEAAAARLRARGVDIRRNKAMIDAEAAAVILEEWLAAHAEASSGAPAAEEEDPEA